MSCGEDCSVRGVSGKVVPSTPIPFSEHDMSLVQGARSDLVNTGRKPCLVRLATSLKAEFLMRGSGRESEWLQLKNQSNDLNTSS